MCLFVIELVSKTSYVTGAILDEKTVALSRPQFSFDFLEILNMLLVAIYYVWNCISAIYVFWSKLPLKKTL